LKQEDLKQEAVATEKRLGNIKRALFKWEIRHHSIWNDFSDTRQQRVLKFKKTNLRSFTRHVKFAPSSLR